MPGKLCDGTDNQFKIKDSKAYCEGQAYRISDTALNAPKTNNPHPSGTDEAAAWDRGWDAADAAAGGAIDEATAGCCATIGQTVQA